MEAGRPPDLALRSTRRRAGDISSSCSGFFEANHANCWNFEGGAALNVLAPPVVIEAPRPGLARRFAKHLRRSLPPLATTLAGSVCWALVMAASAVVTLWSQGWQTPEKYLAVVLLFAVGAALAFPVGLTAARFIAIDRSAETAFAAAFLGFALATVGITAALFALDYRQYYATWHDNFLTIRWVFELVFTTLGALVQFAVLGLRLYFPVGFIALFVAGIWFVRSSR
jgi:hypothetical protein